MEYTVASVPSLISHIHALAADFTNKKLSPRGALVSSHGFILYLLSREERLTKGEIARAVNRDKSTVTHLLRTLKEEGLVQEAVCPTDTRVHYMTLTEKGRQYNALTAAISEELRDVCWKGFSPAEQKTLLSLLLRMEQNIRQSLDSAS